MLQEDVAVLLMLELDHEQELQIFPSLHARHEDRIAEGYHRQFDLQTLPYLTVFRFEQVPSFELQSTQAMHLELSEQQEFHLLFQEIENLTVSQCRSANHLETKHPLRSEEFFPSNQLTHFLNRCFLYQSASLPSRSAMRHAQPIEPKQSGIGQ